MAADNGRVVQLPSDVSVPTGVDEHVIVAKASGPDPSVEARLVHLEPIEPWSGWGIVSGDIAEALGLHPATDVVRVTSSDGRRLWEGKAHVHFGLRVLSQAESTAGITSNVLRPQSESPVEETAIDLLAGRPSPTLHSAVSDSKWTWRWVRKLRMDESHSKASAVIGLSAATMQAIGVRVGDLITIRSASEEKNAMVVPGQQLKNNDVALSPYLMRRKGIPKGSRIAIRKADVHSVHVKVGLLNVEEVGTQVGYASHHVAESLALPGMYEVVNSRTGERMDLRIVNDPYPRQEAMIRLARVYRNLLGLERGDDVVLRPVPELAGWTRTRRYVEKQVHSVPRRLADFMLGSRRVQLSVAPALPWDDRSQVCRVDSHVFPILGIDEGDRAVVRYRGHWISRPLFLRPPSNRNHDDELMDHDRASNSLRLGLDAIGRDELGNGGVDYGTVVDIERDNVFLLKKSLNLTVIPAVGTAVAVATWMSDLPVWVQVLASIFMLASLFYLSLSKERSRVQ